MNKDEWIEVINATCILVGMTVMICSIFVYVTYTRGQGNECLKNPLTYGVEKLGDANGGELICTCNMMKVAKQFPTLYITRNGIVAEQNSIFEGELNVSVG